MTVGLTCANCGCLTEQQQWHHHQLTNDMNSSSIHHILCLKCEQIFVQLQQLNISGVTTTTSITGSTNHKNLSCSSVPQKPQFRFTQSPVDIPQQELQAFYHMNQSPLMTPDSPKTPSSSSFHAAFSAEKQQASPTVTHSFASPSLSSPNRSEVIQQVPASMSSSPPPEPYGNDIDFGGRRSMTTATAMNTSNDASMMMTDDEEFEYGDELNFLINKFDLKEQKKNTFMPYIF